MSESNNQNDLLEQLKTLRDEKELLEKHVFVLNDCLSVEELKTKISDLEKKREMLITLEDLIKRLRVEVEPLNYLKSILDNKLVNQSESELNKIENYKFDMDFLNTDSAGFSLQKKMNEKHFGTIQSSSKSNSGSTVNDGNLDECMQLLDQYDIVTTQEMLNFSEKNHSRTKSVNHEPSTSTINDITNEIQNYQPFTSNVDVKDIIQLKNKANLSKNTESREDNFGHSRITNLGNCSNQLHEADRSQTLENKDDYSNIVFTDLLEKIMITENAPTKENKRLNMSNVNNSDQCHQVDTSNQSEDNMPNSDCNVYDWLMKITPTILEEHLKRINQSKIENNPSVADSTTVVSSNLKENSIHNETPDKENNAMHINETKSNPQNTSYDNNSEININSFNDMNLKIDILRGIYSLGFISPTDLQRRVIVHCLNGRDVIVFSGPNDGKTMTFTIPLLQRIKTSLNECQALVLVPTRNLALHIQKTIMSVGDFLNINVYIGGDNVPKKPSVVPHVIVGTPAGISSMIKCKSLHVGCIQTVVINKADMMLTRDYTELIKELLDKLVENKQVTVLTSSKLDSVLDMYMDILRDPLVIINDSPVEKEIKNSPIRLPKQFYVMIQEEWKLNTLCEINEALKTQKVIVFCNTFDKARALYQLFQKINNSVLLFTVEMNASEHKHNLFSNNVHMIITADPTEGYQFQGTWIINYDLPTNPVSYQNRIAKCETNIKVINLIDENDSFKKAGIEKHTQMPMIQMPLNVIDLLQY